jgi:hypothetical protein
MDLMFDRGSSSNGDFNELGLKLDEVIGIVYQMSEDFFR